MTTLHPELEALAREVADALLAEPFDHDTAVQLAPGWERLIS
jgi:hypothetical protein